MSDDVVLLTNPHRATSSPMPRERRGGRWLMRQLWFHSFLLGERLGVHVLPKHYYTPIQDFHWLLNNKSLWMKRSPLIGVTWDLEGQLDWLETTCAPYYHEVAGLGFYQNQCEQEWGPGFGAIESQVLHCFLRSHEPERIVEIGSGLSTMCMLHAVGLNRSSGRRAAHITCIEPYPRKKLENVAAITLIRQFCQGVPAEVFAQLKAGDLLFIDSSHAVKAGSDVVRIFLEIIPSLPAGVFVHIHDISLPYLYSRRTLSPQYFSVSQETALLLALLTNNPHLSVLAALSALHYDRRKDLARICPDYQPKTEVDEGLTSDDSPGEHFPSSIWLRSS
jgi:Methyltransferase domain